MMNALPIKPIAPIEAVLEELKQPAAYPHSVDGPIVEHETHISRIFLAGKFAYKIKKQIVTDFLDFSTLEKRHHACCEELRLGARYAKGLYVDVVPICFECGEVCVDGDGQPIEFAVRMRRFPEDALLSARLKSKQVHPDDMIQLAEYIAGFHRSAHRLMNSDGSVTSLIEKQSEDNFRVLRSVPATSSHLDQGSLESWVRDHFCNLRDTFESRVRNGFVRECHGDLHCENIVFWHDHWTPFDGIEFNPEYSWIDVLSDVAFLTMDLKYRGNEALASLFLNKYLEVTGDYHALPILRWYMVYRALVRAKVAAICSTQPHHDASASEEFLSTAKSYVDLAESIARAASRKLWITHGLSGSGKTTGSNDWIANEHALRIRSDVERKRLFHRSHLHEAAKAIGQGMYSSTATEATYHALYFLAREIIDAGFPVIIDATFLKYADRTKFRELAASSHAAFGILAYEADEETLRSRIEARKAANTDASDATVQVLEAQIKSHQPLTNDEWAWVVNKH